MNQKKPTFFINVGFFYLFLLIYKYLLIYFVILSIQFMNNKKSILYLKKLCLKNIKKFSFG
ncbi:MAG: hypothetical protein EAZ44_08480 [Cytophagia bacterium]|nr:MAG: hypothetical protein EAZ44_08480 [Cytophagia bacterium]